MHLWSTRTVGAGGIATLPPNAYSDYAGDRTAHIGYPDAARSTARLPAAPMYPDVWLTRTIAGIILIGVEIGFVVVRSLWGLLLHAGLTLSSSGFFAAVGFVAFLSTWRAMTRPHRQAVLTGVLLGALAVALFLLSPYLLGPPSSSNGYVSEADQVRSSLLTACLTIPLALGALAIASFALQDRVGRFLLVAGVVGTVIVSGLLWWWLNPALDAALADAMTTHSFYPFGDFAALWGRLAGLYAIPSGMLLVAYERLYWQLRRQHRALHGTAPA